MTEANCYYVVKMLDKYCTGYMVSGDPGLSKRRSKAFKFPDNVSAHMFIAAWSHISDYFACTMRVVKVRRG